MISQFFILSSHGNPLIFRDFRADVAGGSVETFYRRIKSYKGSDPPPIFHVEGTHYLFLTLGGLYFVFSTRANISPVFAFEFLNKIALTCKDYCGVLDEEAVCSNFSLVYEIVDEMIDFGYPQCTSTEHLKDLIFNEARSLAKSPAPADPQSVLPVSFFGGEKRSALSTAPNKSVISEDRTMKSNEVYVDVLERLTVTISATGHVICSEIDGCIKVRSFLAGSTEILMVLNDVIRRDGSDTRYNRGVNQLSSINLDDLCFHECVNLAEFNKTSSLTFNPPSGECLLMKYHTSGDFHLPFRIHPILEVVGDTQITLQLKVSCEVPKMFHAVGITVNVPVPKSAVNVTYESYTGANLFEYNSKQKTIAWIIRRMNGGSEHHAFIKINLPVVTKMCKLEISPVSMSFEFPMYICSKLQIKSLKVSERNSTGHPAKWVRYITHSDSYIIRL